jgi:ketosteroid isomerase-like protein
MNGNQQPPEADDLQRSPLRVIDRLVRAINEHNLDALTACFADDYVNVTPAHPARSFTGKDQVRQNWRSIFKALPDVQASIVRSTVDGRTVWTEWEHRGTLPQGAPHLLRGVVIFSVGTHTITGARFFLEPVDESDQDATAALDHLLDT